MATLPPGHHPVTASFIQEAYLGATATITCHMEEATMLRDLKIGKLLDTTEGTIPDQSHQKDPGIHMRILTDYVEFLIAITLHSSTGESMNFGSGVVTNICSLR